MYIVGADYHPSFQQIAFLDQETGECGERRLNHGDGEAEKFYRELLACAHIASPTPFSSISSTSPVYGREGDLLGAGPDSCQTLRDDLRSNERGAKRNDR